MSTLDLAEPRYSETQLIPKGARIFVIPKGEDGTPSEACSIAVPGDCIPGGGGTVGDWITHWREEVQKLSIKDMVDFFARFGKDTPESIKNQGPELERLLQLMGKNLSEFAQETFNVYNDNITNVMNILADNTVEINPDKVAVVIGRYFNPMLPESDRSVLPCSVLVSTGALIIATFLTGGISTIFADTAPALGTAACTLIYS